jgi:uncharacterized hydrophobic protein (TIGR00271 family)
VTETTRRDTLERWSDTWLRTVIHIRAVSPTDVTPQLLGLLGANDGVVNLVVVQGVARNPDGDSLQFDVITAEANRVIDELRRHELDRRGSIVIENVDTSISELAAQAERHEPTKANFSPIWEEAEARIRERGTYRPSWFVLLAIAGIIGAVGILTNSQILIVGAMVVGPEYGAMIGVALGIDKRDRDPIRRGLSALFFGFLLAIVVTLLFSLVIRAFDLQPRAFELGIRPVSDLIDSPNAFSVIVAVLAGIVGVVSLTEARASTLIGVFVSVTTIPAAADVGLAMAFGDWSEARGAFVQLLVNVVILIVVGAIGLSIQRRIWGRSSWRTGAR